MMQSIKNQHRKINPAYKRTKLSLLREYMCRGDWDKAFRLASRFPCLGSHRTAIVRAHEALHFSGFYRQLGYDPDILVEAGKKALIERYEKQGTLLK